MALTLRQALKLAESELDQSERQTAELRVVVDGLRAALARYKNADTDRARASDAIMPRTEAVLEVMAERPTPMGVSELTPFVASKRGQNEDRDAISAALSYLKAQGKVYQAASGGWLLSSIPDPDLPADENIAGRLPDPFPPGDVDPDDIPF